MVASTAWFILFLTCNAFATPGPEPGSSNTRKLALLVGIDTYRENYSPVPGTNDAALMAELLGPDGYQFDHVRKLLGKQATERAFLDALEHLAGQAKREDLVVIYFSGHGFQVHDSDGDELEGPNGQDETLILWDSTMGITDDVFANLLANIPSEHVVVIIDACHASGSLRGGYVKGIETGLKPSFKHIERNPFFVDKRSWQKRPRVFLAATSSESNLAFHNGLQSYFTKSLVHVLNHTEHDLITYEQLAHLVKKELSKHGQTASFHGATGLSAFGTKRPFLPALVLSQKSQNGWYANGPIMAGWSPGGLVRIFKKDLPPSGLHQGLEAKATARIEKAGLGKVFLTVQNQIEPPEAGDWVTLAQSGDHAVLRVKFGERIEEKDLQAFKEELLKWDTLDPLIQLVQNKPLLQIRRDQNRRLMVSDEKGKILVRFAKQNEMTSLAWTLYLQAFMRHMKSLQSTKDRFSVKLSPLEPGTAFKSTPSGIWTLPPHKLFRIEVELGESIQNGLVAVGFLLTRNGSIFSVPQLEARQVVNPGHTFRFRLPFQTGSPSDLPETLVIFGLRPHSITSWPEFSWTPNSPPMDRRGLIPEFLETMFGGTREAIAKKQPGQWTVSHTQILTKTLE